MLQNIRDWVMGRLALGVVVALTIPFAFWGINYYFGQGSDILVAKVNNSKITVRDYQRTLQRVRERISQTSPKSKAPVSDDIVKQQALDSLITRALLQQATDDMHLRVGNEQLRDTITGIPAFQGSNGFDRTRYEEVVSRIGLTVPTFEAELRQDMDTEQLEGALSATAFVTDEEVNYLARVEFETRDIRYTMLSSDQIKDRIEVSDSEVKKYYKENGKRYMEPEKVKISYLELAVSKLAQDVEVSDQDLHAYYEANKANYTVAGQRKVTQLLVSVPEKATDKQVEAAHDKAEELYKEIQAGKSMKDLGTQEPADKSGPAVEYSEFGYLTKGVLEPSVDEKVFEMNKGDVSEPIRSKYGFHVVRVDDIEAPQVSSFDDVRAQVEKDYRHAQAEKKFTDMADQLTTITYEHPDTLETAADKLHLPIEQSDWISREKPGEGVLKNPKVLEAAFSDDVLNNGNNSDAIELTDDDVVVLRVSAHEAAREKPLDQVRDHIVTQIKFDEARERTEAKGKEILEKLRSGATPDQVATSEGIQWKQADGVNRSDPDVNSTVLLAAFRAGRPDNGKPLYAGTSLGTGDYAIVQVSKVTDPDMKSLKPEQIDAVRTQLQKYYSADVWSRFLSDLRARAEITVYKDKM